MSKIQVDLKKDRTFVRLCNSFIFRFQNTKFSEIPVNQGKHYLNDITNHYGNIKSYVNRKNNYAMKMNSVDETGIDTVYPSEFFNATDIYDYAKN
jgi:hypothetical protein